MKNLQEMTVKELIEFAKENNIKGYSGLRKSELIKYINIQLATIERFEEEKQDLKNVIEEHGNTIHGEVVHVSQSGMQRAIKFYLKNTQGWYTEITDLVKRYTDFSYHIKGGLRVDGAGMDMIFHVVYTLSYNLYKDSDVERAGYVISSKHKY